LVSLYFSSALTVVIAVCGPQRVPVDVRAHLPPEFRARFLVEAEVNASVYTRVVDVAGHLLEGAVLKDNTLNQRIADRDEVMPGTVQPLEHFTGRVAGTAMS